MPLTVLPSVDMRVEAILPAVLVQLSVIILAARGFAFLFRKIGQPAVVGEIAAGLVLGPSLFGWLFPAISGVVFNPQVGPAFDVLSQLGLIFLLFLVGLEFDFGHLKTHRRAALGISVAGIALPFALGWGLAQCVHSRVNTAADPLGFALFMGTAMSITAIPILGRIMMELHITRTRLGTITITAAAIEDACGWILLAAVSALVIAAFKPVESLVMMGETIGFALLMVFLGRPLLVRWIRHALRIGDGKLGLNSLAILLVILFACAVVTSRIGISAIFGAFLFGAVLSGQAEFRAAVTPHLQAFVTVFFLPIFFTYTGLRTDIGTLQTVELWLIAAAVLGVAVLAKFGGCAAAARLCGFSGREACCIGIMMNTRALMELIVINVGYELGVIPKNVFCMLVLMALVTTLMTTPLLLRLMPGTELEPFIRQSGFVKVQEKPGTPGSVAPMSSPGGLEGR